MEGYEPEAAPEGLTFTVNGVNCTVGPKCKSNDGLWICTTCGELFRHNFEKDSHLTTRPKNGSKTHVLAWRCMDHGYEVP